jgi:hypothetical protein
VLGEGGRRTGLDVRMQQMIDSQIDRLNDITRS